MTETGTNEATQYLSFKLNSEIHTLEVARIREVLEHRAVTKIPNMPDYMKGVIDLRGQAIPVLDLRLKFGMPEIDTTVDSSIIISEISFKNELRIIGVLVDSVQEVLEFKFDQIKPPPKIGANLNTDFIKGLAEKDDGLVIILDIDKIFLADVSSLDSAQSSLEGVQPLTEKERKVNRSAEETPGWIAEKIMSLEEKILNIEHRLSLLENSGKTLSESSIFNKEPKIIREEMRSILREIVNENLKLRDQ